MLDDMVRFPCPKCGQRLKASLKRMGSKIACIACGESLLVANRPNRTGPSGGTPVGEGGAPRVRPAPPNRVAKPQGPAWSLILGLGGLGMLLVLGVVVIIVLTSRQSTPAPGDPGNARAQVELPKVQPPEVVDKTGSSPKEDISKAKSKLPAGKSFPLPEAIEPGQQQPAPKVNDPAPVKKTQGGASGGMYLPIEVIDDASGKVSKRNALDFIGDPKKTARIAMIRMDVTSKGTQAAGNLAATVGFIWTKGKVSGKIEIANLVEVPFAIHLDKGWLGKGNKSVLTKESALYARQIFSLTCCATALVPLEEWAKNSSPLGDSEVRGRKVYGLELASPGGQFKVFFDKKNGLLAKLEWRGRQVSVDSGQLSSGNVLWELFPLDFQEVSGVKQPARLEEWQNGTLFWHHAVTKIQFFEQVDDSLFASP